MIINQFPEYISHVLKDEILKLGDILLKKVAILLSELYDIVNKQSMTKVSEMNLACTKHLLRQKMPKRCFISVLLNFFGKHLTCCFKQRYIGVLLYQPGTDLLDPVQNFKSNAKWKFVISSQKVCLTRGYTKCSPKAI